MVYKERIRGAYSAFSTRLGRTARTPQTISRGIGLPSVSLGIGATMGRFPVEGITTSYSRITPLIAPPKGGERFILPAARAGIPNTASYLGATIAIPGGLKNDHGTKMPGRIQKVL